MASSPVHQISQATKEGLLGPWIASTVASSFLSGIIATQAVNYFNYFSKDRPLYKWTVSVLLALNTFSFIFDAWAVWLQTVPSDAMVNLTRPVWPAVANIFPIVLIATITQIFFGRRAWGTNGKRPYVAGLFAIMILATFAVGMTLIPVKLSVTNPRFLLFLQSWLWMTSATDITITVFLVVSIRGQQHGFNKRTDALLMWLLKSSVSTAAMVSTVAIVDASLSLADVSNIHLPFTHILPRMYTASVLFVLNSRQDLRDQGVIDLKGVVNSHINVAVVNETNISQPPSASMGLKPWETSSIRKPREAVSGAQSMETFLKSSDPLELESGRR